MENFWSIPATELLGRLEATTAGLTTGEAKKRLTDYGANRETSKTIRCFYTSYWPVQKPNNSNSIICNSLVVVFAQYC